MQGSAIFRQSEVGIVVQSTCRLCSYRLTSSHLLSSRFTLLVQVQALVALMHLAATEEDSQVSERVCTSVCATGAGK